MDTGIYISGAALVAVIVHIIRATWYARGLASELREDMDKKIILAERDMDAQIDNIQRDIRTLETAGIERAETLRHEFGETGNALRTKIHEIETWSRDTFVHTKSFDAAITRIEKTNQNALDKIDKRLDSMFEWFKKNGH